MYVDTGVEGGGSLGLVKEGKGDHQQHKGSGCVKDRWAGVLTDTWTIEMPVLSHSSFFSVCYLLSDMQPFEVQSEIIQREN